MSTNSLKYKWDLSKLFKSADDPKIDENVQIFVEETNKFVSKWRYRKDYLKTPNILKEALDDYEMLIRTFPTQNNAGYYLWLKSALDQTDTKIKAKLNMVEDKTVKAENNIQFFTMKLAKIPKARQEIFLEDKALKEYRHFLEKLFEEAKFLLSEKEEKLLNLKSKTSYSNWVDMTSTLLSKETINTKTLPELISLTSSSDKAIRDKAAKNLNVILKKHVGTAEFEINSVLQDKKTNDELRKIQRPDLLRHVSDDIDSNIVLTLIDLVSKRFGIAHRFYKLKAALLGVKKLKYHERNVECGNFENKYSFEDAVNLISNTFVKLDPQFGEIFENLIENGNVDAFPAKGKSGGAFCVGYKNSPTFILLNYTNKLTDVLTIAHESGHAINNELMKADQNALNCHTPLSTAEVASTFMEDFVLEELKKNTDDKTKLSLMMMKLNDDVSTIFRQIACYQFELELHSEFRKKGYLSHKEIGKIFRKWMKAYMGNYVEQSPGCENWWVYWSHIRSFFYVYSYASGLLISKSLQNSVKKDKNFILNVKEFLSRGAEDSPRNIFLRMSIDISDKSFWNNGLNEVENLLNEAETVGKS